MKKVLISLAILGSSLGCVSSAYADCWQTVTGERTGFNYTNAQCGNYMGAREGKPAFGTPSSEEKTTPASSMPTCNDMNDPKCADKPAEPKGY